MLKKYYMFSFMGNFGNINGIFTLTVSETRTGTRTNIMQTPLTLAVSRTKTGHLKVIKISLKHTTCNLKDGNITHSFLYLFASLSFFRCSVKGSS